MTVFETACLLADIATIDHAEVKVPNFPRVPPAIDMGQSELIDRTISATSDRITMQVRIVA